HVCGALNPKTKDLCIRNWVCPVCGSEHNRDHNAAINLKKEAQRLALM
ncbi:MAG: transposase, partial [Solobacterium sp.]|nr:transposase [Solobacterium sp.]